MNRKILFSCILCNKVGVNYQCERCSETYCSENCQVVHWPIHRRMCFPIPNLTPLDNMISLNQSLPNQHSSARQYSTKWDHPNNSVEKAKKLFNGKKTDNQITRRNSRFLTYASPSVCFTSFDEPPMETNIQSKKWFEEFFFGEVTEVVVQYFTENPTTSCWVIQQNDVERKGAILKNLNLHYSFDTIDTEDIKLNNVYIVRFGGACHRGLVLHRINSSDVWVRLIDNGRCLRTRICAMSVLHQAVPTDFKGLAFEINFETLRSIRVGEVLRVENTSCNSDGAIDVRIVDHQETFTDKDIESIPLPLDVAIEMFCLDYSNVDKGYVSACKTDSKNIEQISQISDKISKYCKQTDCDKNYCPKLNELCLAYVEDDGQWYRSKCVENVMPNIFRLEMIDYGALADVSSKNIRKMVKDFMEPTIMHKCAIFGFQPRPETTYKTIAYFKRNPIFCIKKAKCFGGRYFIYLPDLPF